MIKNIFIQNVNLGAKQRTNFIPPKSAKIRQNPPKSAKIRQNSMLFFGRKMFFLFQSAISPPCLLFIF
jgi:hypothetical protein